MELVITPTYEDMFESPVPDKSGLMSLSSSEIFVGIICMLGAELYGNLNQEEAQTKALELTLRRQTDNIKLDILARYLDLVNRVKKRDSRIVLFNRYYLLKMLNFVLLNFNRVEHDDTEPFHDLNFLKVYLVIASEANIGVEIDNETDSPFDWFRKNTWPTLMIQIESNINVNPVLAMIKGQILVNHLLYNSELGKETKGFFNEKGKSSSWDYTMDIMRLVGSVFKKRENATYHSFSLSTDNRLEPFLNSLVLDIRSYKKRENQADFYSGIKAKPLFRFDDENVLILDWNSFANKMFQGLLFDVYFNSRIRDSGMFRSFLDFKKYTSEEVIEKVMFRRIIEKLFEGKHSVLLFDDNRNKAFPDAYVRRGNKIFLFEIKDSFFPARAILSKDYNQIRLAIDEKYNIASGKKLRGVGQLVRNIRGILDRSLKDESLEKLGIKQRNLVIYPIIIYTDINFSAPGIARYLAERFKSECAKHHDFSALKQIQPLAFLGLDFLLDKLDLLCQKETSFESCLNDYSRLYKQREKQILRPHQTDLLFKANESFETTVDHKFKDTFNRNYTRFILEAFNLTQGLPKK